MQRRSIAMFRYKFIVILSMTISFMTLAKEDDFKKEIIVTSGTQDIDGKNYIATLTKDVLVTQGSLSLKADFLQVFTGPERKNNELYLAKGTPATYKQEMDDGKFVEASANEIRYEKGTKNLILIGNAQITQNGTLMKGERLEFNMLDQNLKADSENPEKRVTTIFLPDDEEK